MAHQLSFDEFGNAEAFFARKPAWHGLGVVLDHAPTSEKAIQAAHLDWTVEKVALQTVAGVAVPDSFATVRQDTGAVLGVVSDKYQIVQNSEAFAFLDSLKEDGVIRYESAGALKGGRTVWLLAQMPSVDEIIPGDNCNRYVLFTTSHDGTGAVHAIPTSVRVVCANTLRIAIKSDVGFKHTGNMERKLNAARHYLSQFDEQFTLFRDDARKLVGTKCSRTAAGDYLNELFPEFAAEKRRLCTLRAAKLGLIEANMKEMTNTLKGMKGTWWQIFNAVTESVDHDGREAKTAGAAESRMLSRIDGSGAEFKSKAFQLALQMAAAV